MAKDHDKDDGHKGGGGHGAAHSAHGGGGHEEHEGAPEWLISFADNVMLQMGFFVILLAINMGIKAKGPTEGVGDGTGGETHVEMLDLAIAIRAGFNNPVDLNSTRPQDQALVRRMLERRGQGQSRQPEDAGAGRESQTILPTERSSLGGVVPFDDDSETLTSRGVARAREIGSKLKGMRWVIEVRGHASPSEAGLDEERASTLGFRRALEVARVLADSGIRWDQMRIGSAGAADRRTGRNYDRDADRANQRVEIIVTGEPAPGEPAPSLPAR
jgi:outer membrane protein OmpA-like peptidoglycan-associated protein